MSLPASLEGPPLVALARSATEIPTAAAGPVWMEPKWDGYRLAIVSDGGTTLWSRQRKNLTTAFPEIADAAEAEVPPGCVIDGELVIWTDGRLGSPADSLPWHAGSRGCTGVGRFDGYRRDRRNRRQTLPWLVRAGAT